MSESDLTELRLAFLKARWAAMTDPAQRGQAEQLLDRLQWECGLAWRATSFGRMRKVLPAVARPFPVPRDGWQHVGTIGGVFLRRRPQEIR